MTAFLNALISGHLAVASLFILNLAAGSLAFCLAAPLTWWVVQLSEARLIPATYSYPFICGLQFVAAAGFLFA